MQEQILERLDRIEASLNEQAEADRKPLTLEEAAAYLDVSPSYLYKLTSSQQVPHYKPKGKRIYFLESELRAYLLRNRVSPSTDVECAA